MNFPDEPKKDPVPLLQKHLRAYTAKHQFDYFIHKDLGGFLRRELDFYIKNEVMHLDDIEETTAPKAEEYLSKIRAIRRCALPVNQMLAQLEDFQKKLWLKNLLFIVGLGLGVAAEEEGPSVGGGEVDVGHQDGGELVERGTGGESGGMGTQAGPQGHMEAAGQKGGKDVGGGTPQSFKKCASLSAKIFLAR